MKLKFNERGEAVFYLGKKRVPAPEAIRAARSKFGLSAREFAQQIGVSERTVEGWEQGRPIRISNLNKLATWARINR